MYKRSINRSTKRKKIVKAIAESNSENTQEIEAVVTGPSETIETEELASETLHETEVSSGIKQTIEESIGINEAIEESPEIEEPTEDAVKVSPEIEEPTEDAVKVSPETVEAAEESPKTNDAAEESSETDELVEETPETVEGTEKASETVEATEESPETSEAAEKSPYTGEAAEESHDIGEAVGELHEIGEAVEESPDTEEAAEESTEIGKSADESPVPGEDTEKGHETVVAAKESYKPSDLEDSGEIPIEFTQGLNDISPTREILSEAAGILGEFGESGALSRSELEYEIDNDQTPTETYNNLAYAEEVIRTQPQRALYMMGTGPSVPRPDLLHPKVYPLSDLEAPYVDSPLSMYNSDSPQELDVLRDVKSLCVHKDESRRRTVFEVRLIDGPMVFSTVDTEGHVMSCCQWCSQGVQAPSRFLFDSFGPVILMQEERRGCWTKRSTEVSCPPYNYIGHLYNNSNFLRFRVLVTDEEQVPVFTIVPQYPRNCCQGHNYIILTNKNLRIGSIYRRKDFGWRTAYTMYFRPELHPKHKALLVTALFFLDDILSEIDRGGFGI